MRRSLRSSRRSGTSTDMTTRLQPVVVMEERGSDSTLESDVITTNGYDEYQVPTARRFSSMPTSIRGKERIYDIPTLLNIGSRVVSSDTRKREVHSGANLASFTTRRKASSSHSAISERAVNRRRFSSSLTNSAEDDPQPSRTAHIQYPRRQPVNAPQGEHAQKEAGFARFLKKHASPKHQRVTAGGRIVPMDHGLAPVPEFKLPNKQHANVNYRKTDYPDCETRSIKHPTHAAIRSGHPNTRQAKSASLESTDSRTSGSVSMRTRGITMSDSSTMTQPQDSGSSGHSPTPFHALHQRQEQLSVPQTQGHYAQLSAEACPFTPAYPSFDGGNDQSASAAHSYYPQASAPQYLTEAYPQSVPATYASYLSNSMLGMHSYPAMATTAPVQYFPVNNAAATTTCMPQMQPMTAPFQTATGCSQDPSGNKTLEEVTQEYESISGQLSSLDRYMAIHTWDIDPLKKKALVDQRMDLVRKLDAARIAKEYFESAPQSGQTITQVPSQLPAMFPGIQTVAPCGPVLTGNGMSSSGVASSAADFQQAVRPEQTFTTQIGGPQYANMETFTHGYESYSPEYGFDNHAVSTGGWNMGTEMITRGNNDSSFDEETVRNTVPNKDETTDKESDEWGKDTEMAPQEISNVYRKIERAAQNGELLNPYLKELARVVAQMDVAAPNQNNNTTIQQLHRDSLNYKQKGTTTTAAKTAAGRTHETHLENKVDRRNSVMSQGQVSVGEERKHTMPQEAHRGRTSAQLRLEALHGKPFTRDSASMVDHGKSVDFNTRIRDPIAGAVGGDGADMGKQNISGSKAHELNESHYAAKEHASSDAPKQRGSFFSALSFAPWRQKFFGSAGPKVGISAEAQMINAHGSLPSFDGPGDSKGSTDKKDTRGQTNGQSGVAVKDEGKDKSGSSEWVAQWYQKAPRKEHDAMDVRAFFQMLREEDKETLRNDRDLEHRMLG